MMNILGMIKKLFSRSENNIKMRKALYHSSMNTTMVVIYFMSIMEILFLIRTFIKPESYRQYLWHYRSLYIGLLCVLMIGLFLMIFIRRNFDHRYHILRWFNPASSCFLFAWALGITYIDMLRGKVVDATLFMTIVLCVPLCLYFEPIVFTIIDVVANVVMLVIIQHAEGANEFTAVASFMNYLVFAIIQLVVGVSFLYTRYMLQERINLSEAQRKENEELIKSQSRFFSNMCHEIRTPINTIIGLNEMILREDISDEVAEDAINIRSASNLLLELINEVLDMSKLESGEMQAIRAPYDTGRMLSEVVNLLWVRAKEKKLDFRIDVSPELPAQLIGDENKIRQIMINVLTNAIKYTQEGYVSLEIDYKENGDEMPSVIYTVTDTGIGIKKESIPHLFTAFKRVDEERNRYIEGTGLGLSIVKKYVDLMGGHITVNSVYGQGSTFIIEIPQRPEGSDVIREINFEVHHMAKNRARYKQRFEAPDARILVVDDNEANLLVAGKLLRDTKIKLDTAQSGIQALNLSLNTKYDVILMDHMMPEMDGIECMHKIKEQTGGMSKDAKFVALTANAGSENYSLYEREGFDAYLLKPIEGDVLETEVAKLLPKKLVHYLKEDGDEKKISLSGRRLIEKLPVIISTDSVSDLPRRLTDAHGISVIPYYIMTPSGVFRDGLESNSDGILSYMMRGVNVDSDAPSVKEYEHYFAKLLSRANHIIHISLAESTSNGYAYASEAARSFDNVTVVDSGHLSSGTGLLVLAADQLLKKGLSYEEILTSLDDIMNHIHTSFVVENMDFLSRSGRISSWLNRIASAFMMHPVITLKNGHIKLGNIYLGTREHFWKQYIKKSLITLDTIDTRRLFVTYAGITGPELRWIEDEIRKKISFDEIIFQKASPAITINCGPGTFGLLFRTFNNRTA